MDRKPKPEPLCDPGRPSGAINLTVWSLVILALWGLLVAGAWHFLSNHYQNQPGPTPAASLEQTARQ